MSKTARDHQINMRIDARTKSLISRAAKALDQTNTDFILSTARERATEVVLNNTLVLLDDQDWSAFADALDKPPRSNAKLKALLRSDMPKAAHQGKTRRRTS